MKNKKKKSEAEGLGEAAEKRQPREQGLQATAAGCEGVRAFFLRLERHPALLLPADLYCRGSGKGRSHHPPAARLHEGNNCCCDHSVCWLQQQSWAVHMRDFSLRKSRRHHCGRIRGILLTSLVIFERQE